MTLPEEYLIYPHRAYGMDHRRYDWEPPRVRKVWQLPNNEKLAVMIVVPIEHHFLTPSGKPFKHPGAMVTPYPDLRHYTTRDYGNRVGVYRLLAELRARNFKATFAINGQAIDRLWPLVQQIIEEGHEPAAYGLSTDHIHWGGLALEDEISRIAKTRECFAARGLTPTTWLSPARQQSFATPDLIADAGFTACLDWEHDERPTLFRTEKGRLISVPLSNELDDRTLMIDRRQSEEEWADQIIESVRYLSGIGDENSRVLGLSLTPYVSGQPFRIAALRRALDFISQTSNVVTYTAGALAALA